MEMVSAKERVEMIEMTDELSPAKVMQRYRMLLAEEGEAAQLDAMPMQGERKSKRHKRRNGYSREEIDAILEKNGKLSRAEVLRCKTRYFTDGVAIGSKTFVNGFFKGVKERLSTERKTKASPMKKVNKDDRLYSYRNLQKDIYGR